MLEKKNHILIKDLEVYKLARELSQTGWQVYEPLDWQTKKVIGDQFMTATDSFGANVVEGYGRYHYLDKIKFFYNGRASLSEAVDWWLELLLERKKISKQAYDEYFSVAKNGSQKLQNFINAVYRAKDRDS